MPRISLRIACALAVMLAGVFSALPTAATDAPRLMPPHPSLRDKIKSGEVVLPAGLTHPEAARAAGFDGQAASPAASPLTGSIRALAVLVDFSDKAHQVSANYFDTLLFAPPVAGNGSLRDYWSEVSYAAIDIVSLQLPSALGWRRAPQTYSYYTNGENCTGLNSYPNNCQKLAEDVVDAINGVVNFADYDNNHDGYAEPVIIIHAGSGAEYTEKFPNTDDIWSHSWSLKSSRFYDGISVYRYIIMPEYWISPGDMTIGVFAHEMGHGFWGLPDLYDVDTYYSDAEGVGNWSLMGSGSWNGLNGDTPAWPDAYSRVRMGIAQAVDVAHDTSLSIRQVYNNPPASANTVFRLRSSVLGSNEYWLLENRGQVANTYDAGLPGSGLLIWHVDDSLASSWEDDNRYECKEVDNALCPQHYHVALEQADGWRDLEYGYGRGDDSDPFPGTRSNRNFSAATNPNSSSYYYSGNTYISVKEISPAGAIMTANVSVGLATPGAPAANLAGGQVDLSWSYLHQDEQGFTVERSGGGGSWEALGTNPSGDTSFSDTSALACGTTYEYRLRAYNARGVTPGGPSGAVTTAGCSVTMLPPSDLTATLLSATSARLDWSDTTSGETAFQIEVAPYASNIFFTLDSVPAGTQTYTHTSTSQLVVNKYRVRAYDEINGQYSSSTSPVLVGKFTYLPSLVR
jgi:immune inhibitor A